MYRRDNLEVMRTGRPLLGRIELCFNERGMLDWNVTNKLPLCDAGGKVIGLIATIQEYPGMQRLPVFGGELRPVIEYIFANLGQSLHVSQLAAIAGHGDRQIARRLDLSLHTVQTHIKRLHEKLTIQSRVELSTHIFAAYRAWRIDSHPPAGCPQNSGLAPG